MTHKVCPQHIRESVGPELAAVVRELARALAIPHVAVAFVSPDYVFEFPADLMIKPMRTIPTPANEGLIGQSLVENKIIVWPADEGSATHYFPANPRTILEFAAPIHYAGYPSAVLVADVFEGERKGDYSLDRTSIRPYTAQLSRILDSHPDSEASIRRSLNAMVEECRGQTGSVRGYIAIKTADGGIEYFDNGEVKFLNLTANEGLCGLVFRTGNLLNVDEVWKQENYVASDTTIQSELVIPIKDRDRETVAVLNMESNQPAHYSPIRGDVCKHTAENARELVLKFRTVSAHQNPSSAVMLEMVRYNGPSDFKSFGRFVASQLQATFRGHRPIYWFGPHEDPPRELGAVVWDPKRDGGSHEFRQGEYITYAPIRVQGRQQCIVGVVTSQPSSRNFVGAVENACRIAGEVMEIKRLQSQALEFERVIRQLLLAHDSVSLWRATISTSRIISADQCTIFGVVQRGERSFLSVLASTSERIYEKTWTEMYYEIGGPPFDGITGFVGSTGQPVFEPNLSQMSDHDSRRWSERGVQWKKGISESGDPEIAAFMCVPILTQTSSRVDPAGPTDNVIGVLRVYREKTEGQQGDFDGQSKERIELLCNVLGHVFPTGLSTLVKPVRASRIQE